MTRIVGSIMAAIVAFWIARALGIPIWRNWEPGDASDVAMVTFWTAYLLTSRKAA